MADASLPAPVPGQGNCPPGMRPGSYAGMPSGASACVPIGPGVPAGGWRPAREGGGAGYPPKGSQLLDALMEPPFHPDQHARLSEYFDDYGAWVRTLAGR